MHTLPCSLLVTRLAPVRRLLAGDAALLGIGLDTANVCESTGGEEAGRLRDTLTIGVLRVVS